VTTDFTLTIDILERLRRMDDLNKEETTIFGEAAKEIHTLRGYRESFNKMLEERLDFQDQIEELNAMITLMAKQLVNTQHFQGREYWQIMDHFRQEARRD
jgi:hypothetical protein